MLLLLQLGQLRVLEALQLCLIGLLLQLHQFVLHLQHVKAVGSEEVFFVFLQNLVELGVETFDLAASVVENFSNAAHVVEMSVLRVALAILTSTGVSCISQRRI